MWLAAIRTWAERGNGAGDILNAGLDDEDIQIKAAALDLLAGDDVDSKRRRLVLLAIDSGNTTLAAAAYGALTTLATVEKLQLVTELAALPGPFHRGSSRRLPV